MSAATIDPDALSVRRSVFIAASVDRVWQTITEPALISGWLGETVLDAAGVGTVSWPDRGAVPLRVEHAEAPRTISYRWSNDDASASLPREVDEVSTVFTFTLEPVAGGVRLTVVETGFAALSDVPANLESHRRGWDSELDELVAFAEVSP